MILHVCIGTRLTLPKRTGLPSAFWKSLALPAPGNQCSRGTFSFTSAQVQEQFGMLWDGPECPECPNMFKHIIYIAATGRWEKHEKSSLQSNVGYLFAWDDSNFLGQRSPVFGRVELISIYLYTLYMRPKVTQGLSRGRIGHSLSCRSTSQ